jgi:hypothetical protein
MVELAAVRKDIAALVSKVPVTASNDYQATALNKQLAAVLAPHRTPQGRTTASPPGRKMLEEGSEQQRRQEGTARLRGYWVDRLHAEARRWQSMQPAGRLSGSSALMVTGAMWALDVVEAVFMSRLSALTGVAFLAALLQSDRLLQKFW